MITRKCNKCGEVKEATKDFFYFRKYPEGHERLITVCKECTKAKVSSWNKANKEKVYAKDKRIRQGLSEFVSSLKVGPCTDCGNTYPPICMDFDHLPDSGKIADLATARSRKWSKEKILAEIDKCELVCSNCHRIRTEARRLGGNDE